MYKQRNDKLFMRPLWDFAIAAGNVNYNDNDDPTGWRVRLSPWIARLFEDPAFEARVKARSNELRTEQFDTILDYIDESSAALLQNASNNFQRWHNRRVTGAESSIIHPIAHRRRCFTGRECAALYICGPK